jgi:multisubunit Na+/H+ antiporter MnhF subunit
MSPPAHPILASAAHTLHKHALHASTHPRVSHVLHAPPHAPVKPEGLLRRLIHPFLHPHLRRHIHLGSLNVNVGAWQLLLWAFIIPTAWALYRFVYRRQAPHRRLAYCLLATVVVLQAAAFLIFVLSRNADLLFTMLWMSLVSLIAGAVLLPQLRFEGGRPAQAPG